MALAPAVRPAAPRVSAIEVPTHSASALNASSKPPPPGAHDLAPRAGGGQCARQPGVERAGLAGHLERSGAVSGHPPDREALADAVAQPRVETRCRQLGRVAALRSVLPLAVAAGQREPGDQAPAAVVGSDHRRAEVAAEPESAVRALEARGRRPAPYGDYVGAAGAVQLELRSPEELAPSQPGPAGGAGLSSVGWRRVAEGAVRAACRCRGMAAGDCFEYFERCLACPSGLDLAAPEPGLEAGSPGRCHALLDVLDDVLGRCPAEPGGQCSGGRRCPFDRARRFGVSDLRSGGVGERDDEPLVPVRALSEHLDRDRLRGLARRERDRAARGRVIAARSGARVAGRVVDGDSLGCRLAERDLEPHAAAPLAGPAGVLDRDPGQRLRCRSARAGQDPVVLLRVDLQLELAELRGDGSRQPVVLRVERTQLRQLAQACRYRSCEVVVAEDHSLESPCVAQRRRYSSGQSGGAQCQPAQPLQSAQFRRYRSRQVVFTETHLLDAVELSQCCRQPSFEVVRVQVHSRNPVVVRVYVDTPPASERRVGVPVAVVPPVLAARGVVERHERFPVALFARRLRALRGARRAWGPGAVSGGVTGSHLDVVCRPVGQSADAGGCRRALLAVVSLGPRRDAFWSPPHVVVVNR